MKTYNKILPETNVQNIENFTGCYINVYLELFFFFFFFFFFCKWPVQIKHNHTKCSKRFDAKHCIHTLASKVSDRLKLICLVFGI